MENFRGIIFIWKETYREIFKSALESQQFDKVWWWEFSKRNLINPFVDGMTNSLQN